MEESTIALNSTAEQSSQCSTASLPDSKNNRRPHNRGFRSLLSVGKIRHLKKKDGEPLWRADIQYDFLCTIFKNKQAVFTDSTTQKRECTFADIYIKAMARSSKCSKILSDRLLGDREAALSIAMVCLLVNIGRMNTTLNFFPEMKAQLRTYHPIPSLQSNDTADYKQLQDAPRLKSILKGACEEYTEISSLEQIAMHGTKPNTNPIHLVFLMSTYPSVVENHYMPSPFRFFDLVVDYTFSSQSRGIAFLWLMWTFLETDLSPEQVAQNPFGSDLEHIPRLVKLSEEEVLQENVDPPSEISFGNQMTLQRLQYLEGSGPPPTKRSRIIGTTPQSSSSTSAAAAPEIPPPKTFQERRVLYEFKRLLFEKRARRRQRRFARQSPIKDCWEVIKEQECCDTAENDNYGYVADDLGERLKSNIAVLKHVASQLPQGLHLEGS